MMDWMRALSEAVTVERPTVLVTVVAAPGREELVGRHMVVGADGVRVSEFQDPVVEGLLLEVAAESLAAGRTGTVSLALGQASTVTPASGRTATATPTSGLTVTASTAPGPAGAGLTGPSQAGAAVPAEGLRVYIETHLPPPSLVVVGAGHVAQPIAHFGKLLGYRVTVVDDRPAYANQDRFPEADRLICDQFLPALRSLQLGPRDHIILVTRGHRHDMACLREVLERPVAYIGMIGSRTRVETVFRLLTEEEGVDPARFEKVYAPIGLDIGARTPEEIAVAVAAELLKVRSGGTGESLSRLGRARVHSGSRAVADASHFTVLEEMQASEIPVALATIIHTRGHCPREIGAKMLVRRDGRIAGTVGGGCGEAQVRQEALTVLDQGRPSLLLVDLLDDPSLEEGAVCGGKMEVFVEPIP